MRNVGRWIKQNSNRNSPIEVSNGLVGAYDFLFDLAYGNCDYNLAMLYLGYGPESVNINNYSTLGQINYIHICLMD
jgi:hypothetical protein